MYVVIPVRDKDRNLSLPHALASIARHTDYTPLTIGRDLGLCEHIATVQQPGQRFARRNTNLAMRTACELLAEPFIWSNDDVYWLRPATPIRWALGDLRDAQGSTLNRTRKQTTADWLSEHGLPTWDYEAHVPMLIDPMPMLDALEAVDANPDLEKRSLFGNMTGLPERVAPDVKLRNPGNRHRAAEWASTQGDPMAYGHLGAMLAA